MIFSNNIRNFQESTTILNACTKKSGNLLKAHRIIVLAMKRKNEKKKEHDYRNRGLIYTSV